MMLYIYIPKELINLKEGEKNMSRREVRKALGTIFLSYFIALFCMLPNASDFGINFEVQKTRAFQSHSSEVTERIEEFTKAIEKVQPDEEIKKEENAPKIINVSEEPVVSEELATETKQPVIETEKTEIEEVEEVLPESVIDGRLPGAVYLSIDENSPENPIILSEQRLTSEDILVDLSIAIDHTLEYDVSEQLEICISKIVFREAGTQPFLGKVFVAEGIVNRLRSGVYGSDVAAILKQGGYNAEMDESGVFHVYHSDGTEVFEVPEADIAAAKIALRGSTLSNVVLKMATQMRNNQYDIELGEECYRYGCIYHYNPDLVSDKELNKRTINQAPVSFRYVEHVFYGYWINAKYALNII